jgi:hypothetical protein
VVIGALTRRFVITLELDLTSLTSRERLMRRFGGSFLARLNRLKAVMTVEVMGTVFVF